MSAGTATALAVAALFAVFTGFVDAGVLVGIGTGARGLRPAGALAVLTTAVLAAPFLVGTGVATTLNGRLVPGGGPGAGDPADRVLVLVGVGAAVGVTVVLAARRLPTSLTLALIGGIAGAGAGGGLVSGGAAAVDWAVLGAVLTVAAVAPVVGAVAALAAGRLLAAWPAPRAAAAGGVASMLRYLHLGGFATACLAYGANDGQKMLAVYAALFGGGPDRYAESPGALLLIACCFLLGGLLGVRRLGAAGVGLAATRQDGVVMTELSSAGVVLGTAAVGAPVSMTQSISGALVGAGLSRGTRRVRWRTVLRLSRAWVVTLPAAFVAGGACAALVSLWC